MSVMARCRPLMCVAGQGRRVQQFCQISKTPHMARNIGVARAQRAGVWADPGIVNQTLTRVADYFVARSAKVIPVLPPESRFEIGWNMQRLRLKADGRIVELRDGREFPLAPAMPLAAPVMPSAAPGTTSVAPGQAATAPAVRDLRLRARLTQLEFATRLGVPVETIRNWEQGKRIPRGPARALLAVIAHAPETVFSALARPRSRTA